MTLSSALRPLRRRRRAAFSIARGGLNSLGGHRICLSPSEQTLSALPPRSFIRRVECACARSFVCGFDSRSREGCCRWGAPRTGAVGSSAPSQSPLTRVHRAAAPLLRPPLRLPPRRVWSGPRRPWRRRRSGRLEQVVLRIADEGGLDGSSGASGDYGPRQATRSGCAGQGLSPRSGLSRTGRRPAAVSCGAPAMVRCGLGAAAAELGCRRWGSK